MKWAMGPISYFGMIGRVGNQILKVGFFFFFWLISRI
jgi:hypothetical protein